MLLEPHDMSLEKLENIAVIGLGYVGLPMAIELSKQFSVIAYDIDELRIENLNKGYDWNGEYDSEQLLSPNIIYTSNSDDLKQASFYIVSVPTPVDERNIPNLAPLIASCETIARYLESGDIVVFESTVYPGATEEICMPVLEKKSDLRGGRDFFVGYSPERINPSDTEHTLRNVQKIIAAQDENTLKIMEDVYSKVVDAGLFKASSIKVAEAAKVIENTQRDINIAFVNELSMIFQRMDIPTYEVLEAAGTKWNFLKFSPGLVGGHCIGVDPYYLTAKAQELGYHPEMILAGRRINDNMPYYIAEQIVLRMLRHNLLVENTRVLILGFSFKENCSDTRNTKVYPLAKKLEEYKLAVDIHEPLSQDDFLSESFHLNFIPEIKNSSDKYQCVVLAVPHQRIKQDLEQILKKTADNSSLVVDIKNVIPKNIAEQYFYWAL